MGKGIDHGLDIAEWVQDGAGTSVIDVVLDLGSGFGGSATGGEHLHDFIGHQFASGFDLLVGGRPGEYFSNFVKERLRDSGCFHDVGLLTEILGDHHSRHVQSYFTILVHTAHHQLWAIDIGQ